MPTIGQTEMEPRDFLTLLHPAIAVAVVFPMIGIAVNMAWQTRQRRLQTAAGEKPKIPPSVGLEHVKVGRWLTGGVVGSALLAMIYSIGSKWQEAIAKSGDNWQKDIPAGELKPFGIQFPFSPIFVVLLGLATITSLVLLYRAGSNQRVWRGVFATLTGMGLVILGTQEGVYRLDNMWYFSHYYYGLGAALLMIFALAIVPDIYQDRANRWRMVHALLNSFALLLFAGQALTGTRDLLEIPLGWQKPHIYQCDFVNKTCPTQKSQLDTPLDIQKVNEQTT